ncbi:MAG TPA: DEAD/DEAH box helicase [Firmicutes bacterium]|nr:DEAD/DEAH box helicase [Bacillota bacterium]
MAINPINFTEKVVGDFLRYQVTAYAFADPALHAQLRDLLSLEKTRQTPLMKGPYISLSRSFRAGAEVRTLIDEGIFHPFMQNLIPYKRLYGHQERAIRAIRAGKTTLISTGTGSGKTECFLYPIISRCLELRDQGAPSGIVAVIVYPMNALAEDQLERLREILAGTGIPFGMYVGKTPESAAEVSGTRLPAGSSRADYLAALAEAREERRETAIHPPEERVSREEMRTPGKQPRILLTNVKQLEFLLTRQIDIELFDNAQFDFLVFDEAHTYGGAIGAETACLIRRFRAFCGKGAKDTVCIATSATLADPRHGTEGAQAFAARFFGMPESDVVLVGEEYEPDEWAPVRELPPALPGDPAVHLQTILEALDAGERAGSMIRPVVQAMTGTRLDPVHWQEGLYDLMARNELCYQLSQILSRPRALGDLVKELEDRIGRPVPEEEVLVWLALGAASMKGGRPLLRPVVHVFVRGVSGAVVTFPGGGTGPCLWLSAEDQIAVQGKDSLFRLPVLTCNTCGQHYFVHHVKDLTVTARGLGGGDAIGGRRVWPALDPEQGGVRVVLLDHLAFADDEEEEPARTHEVFFCRYCGALHPQSLDRCDACGREASLVRLFAVEHDEKYPGYLTSCLACRSRGRPRGAGYREPARPVRAINVSDVHVLAQNMIHYSDRRRLLVFADNRQDAAFQAGWMRDHARRFRLRSLMAEYIERGSISIGDLVAYMDERLDADDDLSRSLIPEVWRVARKEAEGVRHAEERRYFLRIQVLREIATGIRQQVGLEPWGKIKIEYRGLTPEHAFIREWASRLNLDPVLLTEGIGAILDLYRRQMVLFDRDGRIFSRFWSEGDREVQRGYLPLFPGIPKGLKLSRSLDDDSKRVAQWLSQAGDTLVRQAARAWGVPRDEIVEFLEGLWGFLAEDLEILVPVTLIGSKGNALPHCAGVRQIDADILRITPNQGLWRCQKCRRAQVRPTPGNRCLAFHCDGTLTFEPPDPDNYDLTALDQRFAMVRPAEHSAQVPDRERERLESLFKSEGETVNTLVCTPTLELGINIGSLDTVLMRNVPPLPSNYWQRVGRAGRQHRLAVNITYARAVDHDRAYFAEPLKLLEGLVEPPRFNLRNEFMIAKHVHAAVITHLHQLCRDGSPLNESDREEIAEVLRTVFPPRIRSYLFDDNGHVRGEVLDVGPLHTVIAKHAEILVQHILTIFRESWPKEDTEVVTEETLGNMVLAMPERLADVLRALRKRLDWARGQMERLDQVRRQKGTLDPDEDALYGRCDRLIKKLKGIHNRRRREAEGYDDTSTYSVLAAEGFLPGYGLEVGSIVGTAMMPRYAEGNADFDLPRPLAIALREYVPGNLIYANGHRFVARYFHLEPVQPVLFQVDTGHESVIEVGSAMPGAVSVLGQVALKAVPVCDVELAHVSHISDEEEYRFQLPVAVYGYETGRHGPGKRFSWGGRDVTLRRGVHMRLVNVGAAPKVASGELGYPLCLVSGQSRSPLASDRELEEFSNNQQERYGQPVEPVGFFADIIADALCLPGLPDRKEAYSVLEALRTGMSHVLEMERDDLEILVIGHPGQDEVDGILYDPMPGGSGLLEQACERWGEVVGAATEVVEKCPSACQHSCIDCLQTFRNAFYHKHLDRHIALERFKTWGTALGFLHDIPPRLPNQAPKGSTMPVNEAEEKLRQMLRRAGFPEPQWQHQIQLGKPLGSTTPDCFFPGDDDDDPGICVYLDGLSEHIHGNPATAARDRAIRDELRARGYEVREIPASDLDDRDAMARHFFGLARILLGKERAREIREDRGWFGD